jgi:Polyketide cyclase / dehydrase and lipid transport
VSTREPADISASGLVPAGREAVFAFLAELDNHWRVADRWIDVVALDGDGDGGHVRLHGPLGLRRTARTQVLAAQPPALLEGNAELGRTLARVSWTLQEHPRGTLVQLEARVERAGAADRLLLALGGRAWLRRRFAVTLAHLAATLRTGVRAPTPARA